MKDILKNILNKNIYMILDGDTNLDDPYFIEDKFIEIKMPYLKGVKICDIAKEFDFAIAYVQNGQNFSRWQYMEQLFSYAIKNGFINDLLYYFFDKKNFSEIYINNGQSIGSQLHSKIVNAAINKINDILYISDLSLSLKDDLIEIRKLNLNIKIKSTKINKIDREYLNSSYDDLKFHLENNKYNNVISNSRTLLEETLIFMLEIKNCKNLSNGDLQNLFKQVKDVYCMNINTEMDKSLKKLLSGLNTIVQSIGELRNKAGSSHGTGKAKITVNYAEASFIANSAISICDYLLFLANNN